MVFFSGRYLFVFEPYLGCCIEKQTERRDEQVEEEYTNVAPLIPLHPYEDGKASYYVLYIVDYKISIMYLQVSKLLSALHLKCLKEL
jgi:hypothetical protein